MESIPAWFPLIVAGLALVGLAILFIASAVLSGSRKKERKESKHSAKKAEAADTHTKDDHEHKPAAKSGGHDDHGHHGEKKDGWGLLRFSIGLLAFVTVAWAGYWVYRYVGLDSIPKTRGQAQREQVSSAPSASSYQASVIPSTACSVTPKDARKVIAPVDGCSETIPVQNSGWYLCSDPGISSERVRSKSWFGSTEPTSWGDASTKGNKVCLGAAPSQDPAVPTEAVTVRVWEEKKVLP